VDERTDIRFGILSAKKRLGQGLEPGFTGDHGPSSAFRAKWEILVFQGGFGFGTEDTSVQFGSEEISFTQGFQDGFAAFLEFPLC
jgi:hypothetical protein